MIVEAADLLGHQDTANQPDVAKPSLLRSDELVAAFRRLDETRAAQDYRCLGSATQTNEEANNIHSAMDHADESSQSASQAHTQYAFGTQIPHQSRPRPLEDEPRILSVKRLEPVLAGNTQREDIPTRAAASRATPADVLRLLQRQTGPAVSKPSTNSLSTTLSHTQQKTPPKTTQKPHVPTDFAATQMQTQLPVHVDSFPTQVREIDSRTSPGQGKARTPRRLAATVINGIVSPTRSGGIEQQEETMAAVQEAEINHLQTLISECAWMQDMEFTRDSFKVPSDQLSLLRSDSSWHKPLPGHRFPDGNVPIGVLTTFHRKADEAAAMEAAPDSDEEMDEDPSPEFPISTIDPSPEDAPENGQDAYIATSQVSWSPSPSPVPPKLLTRSNQQLPPDSSFEATCMPNDGGTKGKMPQPVLVESSNNASNADEQHEPPSSPPVTSDDDIEMEEYVPQGLGEDSVGVAHEMQPDRAPTASPPPDSVVQVHETPYVKGKAVQDHSEVVSPSLSRPASSNSANHTSSLSVVRGTYDDKVALDHQEQAAPHGVRRSATRVRDDARSRYSNSDKDGIRTRSEAPTDTTMGVAVKGNVVEEVLVASHQQEPQILLSLPTNSSLVQDETLRDVPEIEIQPVQDQSVDPAVLATQVPSIPEHQPQTTNSSEQAAVSASPVSGRVKRKHTDSPTKRSSRHSKRREIKLVGFDLPRPKTPISALPNYREDFSRKTQESAMSNSIMEDKSRTTDRTGTLDAIQIDSFSVNSGDAPAPGMSPRHESLYEDPSETVVRAAQTPQVTSTALPAVQSRSTPVAEASGPHTRSLRSDSSTKAASSRSSTSVLSSFKAAYPEYTGDAKHFKGQCKQMIELDEEDKMVPKWQWDDYIIRNRTDFKEYALQCVDQGENIEPYHRFYKDSIRDTVYNKGIIASRATLVRALGELNDGTPQHETQVQPEVISRKPKRLRASLPSAFDQTKTTLKNRVSSISHEQSRHSLPAEAQRNRPASAEHIAPKKVITSISAARGETSPSGRSTPQADHYSRLTIDGAASSRTSINGDATSRTGDQFRDFCFAFKRTTSMTGSTNVSVEKSHGNGKKG